MGVPILKVDYKFSLTPEQAELFDEMLQHYSSDSFCRQMEAIGNGDVGLTHFLQQKHEKIMQMQCIIVSDSKAIQE